MNTDNNGWISVKERLPEDSERVWCYLEHIDDLGISHFQWNMFYDHLIKEFYDNSVTDGEKVTHWRPLPPPPIK